MRVLAALLCLCACAAPVYDTRPAIERATSDTTIREYFARIPVHFIPGSVDGWCPKTFENGQWVSHPACFIPGSEPAIYVSTVNLDCPQGASGCFTFVQDLLDEEFGHALQDAKTCHTWHPVKLP